MSETREFDWHEQCPFCDMKFHGFRNARTVEENPYVALLEHVPKTHPEQLVPCSGAEPVAFWRKDDTCSNCGGLKPDIVLANIESGHAVCPTDKNYKIYVDPGDRKAYFYHFSKEQKQKFIELYNAKTMKLGEPGYFYVLPFFMKLA